MVINGNALYNSRPIARMENHKWRGPSGVTYGLTEGGYDIRIKQEITFRRSSNGEQEVLREWTDYEGETVLSITKGRFILASAMEEFTMPGHLMGIVHDKSSWARQGLSVFNTVIEPGWRGFLTLELVYHGQEELKIQSGAGIAQVIFHKLHNPSQYVGRYQDQADMPVPARV